jgi:uncharacterized protein YndB with AHSA1/START domain
MAAITESIEIARKPEDVFAYLDDLSRHGEWQEQIVSVKSVTEGPTRVGSRATEIRHAGGRDMEITYEVTEHDPPHAFAFKGINGPVRPVGRGRLEQVGEGTRFTIELDFQGHGLAGKLLAPLARSQAHKEVPKNQKRLKERLESGAA